MIILLLQILAAWACIAIVGGLLFNIVVPLLFLAYISVKDRMNGECNQ